MKRLICNVAACIAAVVLLLSFAGCTPEEQQPTQKQVWLMTKSYSYMEGTVATYTYNEYGNEIRTESRTVEGIFRGAWICEYDQNQNLIKRSVDSGDGSPHVQVIQTYDEKGRLIKKEEFSSSSSGAVVTYEYNGLDQLIYELVNDRVTTLYTYNDDGSYKAESVSDPETYKLYNKYGKVVEIHQGGQLDTRYVYTEEGILTELFYYAPSGAVTMHYRYESDEHGNMIKAIRVFDNGTEDVVGEYEYQLFTVKIKPDA